MIIRRVVGHSLLPYIQPGRIVVVRKGRDYVVDDLVVARKNGREVIKFVSKRVGGKVYLKGTKGHDVGWVDKQDIYGRVIWPRKRYTKE